MKLGNEGVLYPNATTTASSLTYSEWTQTALSLSIRMIRCILRQYQFKDTAVLVEEHLHHLLHAYHHERWCRTWKPRMMYKAGKWVDHQMQHVGLWVVYAAVIRTWHTPESQSRNPGFNGAAIQGQSCLTDRLNILILVKCLGLSASMHIWIQRVKNMSDTGEMWTCFCLSRNLMWNVYFNSSTWAINGGLEQITKQNKQNTCFTKDKKAINLTAKRACTALFWTIIGITTNIKSFETFVTIKT